MKLIECNRFRTAEAARFLGMSPGTLRKDKPGNSGCRMIPRILSLWEIVNHFDLLECTRLCEMLEHIIACSETTDSSISQTDVIVKIFHDIVRFCDRHGFNICRDSAAIEASRLSISPMVHPSVLSSEARNISTLLTREIYERKFLWISKDRSEFIDNDLLIGEIVSKAFPLAKNDIKETGNCLAAECNTAAVFHLMRIVEWGLRALCVHLGFRKMCNKYKATGNITYVPVEYLEWDKILNQLHIRVDERIAKIKRGPQKQEGQEFYYPILQDINAIRDAWRNHVMHTRAEYTREDAIAIMEHVKRIMSKLATRISEV